MNGKQYTKLYSQKNFKKAMDEVRKVQQHLAILQIKLLKNEQVFHSNHHQLDLPKETVTLLETLKNMAKYWMKKPKI